MTALAKHHPHQTLLEEIFNTLTHGIGFLLAIAALVVLVVMSVAHSPVIGVVASTLFGVSLVLMYGASTLYHGAKAPELKRFFKVCDHACIYLLIAGTYTPFTLVTLKGAWGWSLFGVIWGLALAGLVFKFFTAGRYELVSLSIYLLMGWLVLIAIKPLMQALPAGGLTWLVSGGVCYTMGVIFYACDSRYHFSHALWHLFVLAGSICHFFAVLFYVIG